MQEQVNDMAQTLQAIAEELQLLRQSNEAQYNLICRLNRNSGAQMREIRSLRKENSFLRERLSRYGHPPKDSNNSSTPPGKEDMKSEVQRRTNSLREKSDNPIGGQKGHEGSTRQKSGNVDEIVDHTSDYCSCCGYDISANVVTLVFRRGRRSGKVLEDMFGDALKNMTAVTDRHSAYFALNFISLQICLSHILREVQYLNESDDKQQWPVELQTLLREAIHHRNQNPDKVIDSSVWLLQLDNILKQNVAHLKDDFRRLKNGLIKYRDYIFKFLEDPAIPPDNNASEPGIRKLKIKQKISGTFRPDQGADAFMAIHSIADTAWKNRQAPFQPILEVMQNTSNSFAGRVCQKSTPSLFIQKVRTFPSSDFFISQRYRIFRHTIFHYAKVTI